jgi:hypothetical protein
VRLPTSLRLLSHGVTWVDSNAVTPPCVDFCVAFSRGLGLYVCSVEGIVQSWLQLVRGTVCCGRNFEAGRRFSDTYRSLESSYYSASP